jgi:hypothetical protein
VYSLVLSLQFCLNASHFLWSQQIFLCLTSTHSLFNSQKSLILSLIPQWWLPGGCGICLPNHRIHFWSFHGSTGSILQCSLRRLVQTGQDQIPQHSLLLFWIYAETWKTICEKFWYFKRNTKIIMGKKPIVCAYFMVLYCSFFHPFFSSAPFPFCPLPFTFISFPFSRYISPPSLAFLCLRSSHFQI